MAHLEVEPKPSRPWWVWVLLIIVIFAIAAMIFKKCNTENTANSAVAGKDSSAMASIATTVPDWNKVDFNSAATTDPDISDSDIVTRSNGIYTIYTLGENILFPSDGNDVSEKGQAKLQMISNVLNKRFEGSTIAVFGNTDSEGSTNANKELGKRRAEAVKSWLISTGKIAAETLSIQSLGETEPVASNQTKNGRQQNRNVSIVVFPKR